MGPLGTEHLLPIDGARAERDRCDVEEDHGFVGGVARLFAGALALAFYAALAAGIWWLLYRGARFFIWFTDGLVSLLK